MVPPNPFDFIKSCVTGNKVYWTYHVNMRLQGRHIPREYVLNSVDNYEIIEEYPEDKYLPSYLVYSRFAGRPFHVLFAADLQDDNVRVITAYYPSLEEWEDDLKTRRRLQ